MNHRSYIITTVCETSVIPAGYQLAITGSTTALGEWDETRALPMIPDTTDPRAHSTSLLPAPQSTTRVEFRWILINEGAKSITEGVDPQRVYKYVDIEPDFEGLPEELQALMAARGQLRRAHVAASSQQN